MHGGNSMSHIGNYAITFLDRPLGKLVFVLTYYLKIYP
jgi:hypothetical protein